MFWLSIAFYILYIYIYIIIVIIIHDTHYSIYIYMEFLWYSLYVGSLYNNDTSNTRSANTVGVVLFCPVSNESSTFVALSIFVLYIVYQSRIYIFDRFWPSHIILYITYPVVQYIFLSRLCYVITLEIFSIVCVLSSLLSSLLPFKYYIWDQ